MNYAFIIPKYLPNAMSVLSMFHSSPPQSSSNTTLPFVDQVIQFPNQLIPPYSHKLKTLTTEQVQGLNNLFNTFPKVDNSIEPVEPGRATTYENWNTLCIGEQGQSGCPRSAKHEILSYGDFHSNDKLWTSRGWVLYKP